LDISGGIPAEITITSGILTPDVVSGCILGYVRYPGGGVPLSSSHFVQSVPLSLGITEPLRTTAPWVIPVFNNYMVASSSGGTLDLTSTFVSSPKFDMYLKIRNNGISVGTTTIVFPFKVNQNPYSLLQITVGTDINAVISVSFIDSLGSTYLVNASPITGFPNLNLYSYDVSRDSVQQSNTLVYIQLQMQVSPSREIKLQSLGLNEYNLPL
jgi:hypothetical protein